LPALGTSVDAIARLVQKRAAKRRLCFVCAHAVLV
jgi:hypothetical protein